MFKNLGATAALCLWAVTAPIGASAQSADIQSVISSQIDAFQSDDFATAFTFAAPTIKQMFRNSDNFGVMVQRGYPMVWRPSKVQFGALKIEGGQQVQKVFLTDRQGTQYVALYTMTQTGEGWKIAGVQILRPTDVGT